MIKIPIPCIVCDDDVTSETENFMVAIEVPYANIFMHRCCYKEIQDNLLEFMKEKLENYLKKDKNKKK